MKEMATAIKVMAAVVSTKIIVSVNRLAFLGMVASNELKQKTNQKRIRITVCLPQSLKEPCYLMLDHGWTWHECLKFHLRQSKMMLMKKIFFSYWISCIVLSFDVFVCYLKFLSLFIQTFLFSFCSFVCLETSIPSLPPPTHSPTYLYFYQRMP